MADPAFCVIAQGSKEILLGEDHYRYDPAHYLLTTVDLPLVDQIIEASPEQPHLGLRLELDPTLINSVMVETGHPAPQDHTSMRGINVSPLDAGLLDAVVRLVRLLETPPTEARFLAPLIMREIAYRLLMGSRVTGSIKLRSWGAAPTASSGRLSGCGKGSTSRCGWMMLPATWA